MSIPLEDGWEGKEVGSDSKQGAKFCILDD
jgi:hypothetical protein